MYELLAKSFFRLVKSFFNFSISEYFSLIWIIKDSKESFSLDSFESLNVLANFLMPLWIQVFFSSL
ncbi:hypothetical protein R7X75_03155 [Mesomycoplasma ovipneumoniae]|nr:hypothetical protein [Mesomycoplasma ovipneumoniae]